MAVTETAIVGRINSSPYLTFRNPIEYPFNQQNHLRMINLLEMSSDQRRKFMAGIASCNHALQIWVHTHDDEGMKPDYREDTADLVQYLSNRDKMIKFSYRAKLPILCLIGSNDRNKNENGETLASYANYYAKLNEGREGSPVDLYYLPTLLDRSCPLIKGQEPRVKYTPEDNKFQKTNWDLFYEMLKELGVNIVIIRGRNLRWREIPLEAEDSENRDFLEKEFLLRNDGKKVIVKKPGACLGSALLALAVRGMDVRLSRVVHTQSQLL